MASSMTTLSSPAQAKLLNIPKSYSAPSRVQFISFTNTHSTRLVMKASSTPKDIQEKVSESIKQAQQTCAEDPVAGECVAAWDEVEELSAAASHARDKTKTQDPLDEYCKDNPETDECRIYED